MKPKKKKVNAAEIFERVAEGKISAATGAALLMQQDEIERIKSRQAYALGAITGMILCVILSVCNK